MTSVLAAAISSSGWRLPIPLPWPWAAAATLAPDWELIAKLVGPLLAVIGALAAVYRWWHKALARKLIGDEHFRKELARLVNDEPFREEFTRLMTDEAFRVKLTNCVLFGIATNPEMRETLRNLITDKSFSARAPSTTASEIKKFTQELRRLVRQQDRDKSRERRRQPPRGPRRTVAAHKKSQDHADAPREPKPGLRARRKSKPPQDSGETS